MAHFTRVLSKDEAFPALDELRDVLRAAHPGMRLMIESGDEDDWEELLLATEDEVEVAVVRREPVFDGSAGQDEIADLLEDAQDAKPENAVLWLAEYLDELKTVYVFQHLQGAELEDGGNALHALRSALWERGDAIIQADNEGFTNEEGFHILWQFSDSVSGPWNMGVYKDDHWHHFKMDLGDPDHRQAFLAGEIPEDTSGIQLHRAKN